MSLPPLLLKVLPEVVVKTGCATELTVDVRQLASGIA